MSEAAIGDEIGGRYRIIRPIARGGFASTYEAEQIQTHARVLLKALTLERALDWKAVELFERESTTLSQLDHPGIPRYIDHFQIDSAFYTVQTLVPGQTLAERVKLGWRPSQPVAEEIARQLLGILSYLHAFQPAVVHRDIKPENVIWTDDGHAYLIDFGAVVARALGPGQAGSTVTGTFGYMPPEQTRGQAEPRSDLYALGTTLLAVLTHRAPEELPMKRLRFDVVAVANVTPPFARFLERMVEPIPEDRYASAQAALEGLAGRSEQPARPKPTTHPGIGLGAVAVLLIAAGAGVMTAVGVTTSDTRVPVTVIRPTTESVPEMLAAIRTAQESFRAERDFYVTTAPVGPGTAEPAVWDDEPCNTACSDKNPSACARFSCIGIQPGKRVSYRYACNAVGGPRGPTPDFTCAASADLDGDGKSKMFVYGTANGLEAKGRIVAPIPDLGDQGACKDGQAFAGEVVDCDPAED